jgi:putative nucleotidyltransferase with HDIG domain
LVFSIFAVATALILPRSRSLEWFPIKVGDVWEEADVRAPFDFPIYKQKQSVDEDLARIQNSVHAVFMNRHIVVAINRKQLLDYFAECREIGEHVRKLPRPAPEAEKQRIRNELEALRPPIKFEKFVNLPPVPEILQPIEKQALAIFDHIYANGFINRATAELTTPYISLRQTENNERLVEVCKLYDNKRVRQFVDSIMVGQDENVIVWMRDIISHFCQPNYTYNEELTEAEKRSLTETVSHYYGKIKRGDLIVRQNEIITPEIFSRMESLQRELALRNDANPSSLFVFLGQLIITSLLTIVTVQFLRANRREVYLDIRKTILVLTVMFLMTGLTAVIQQFEGQITAAFNVNYYCLVPVCIAAAIITVFLDDRIGSFCNVITTTLSTLAVHHNFEFFLIQFCAGSVAVFRLKLLHRRSQFFTTALYVGLTYTLAYVGYNLYLKDSFYEINYGNIVLFWINVLFMLGTYPLIYLFERVFGISSDLTYIELLDTNHPLLKKMSLDAPGTYQHSLQVATIAEAAASKIGAHALQVRVGALFHDIGKIKQPEYFIENQSAGHNPHDKMANPKLSAEIILNHVDYGVELAQQYRIPNEIIDFIRTHHGTTRVEYFYRTYVQTHPNTKTHEEEFRYRGPLPSSKEMAILMISDSVEAASRALDHPTNEDLEKLVEHIIAGKIRDGQLVSARLTFRDLTKIKNEIITILKSIFHSRIKYPEAAEVEIRKIS